jgi:hypothetical protein
VETLERLRERARLVDWPTRNEGPSFAPLLAHRLDDRRRHLLRLGRVSIAGGLLEKVVHSG